MPEDEQPTQQTKPAKGKPIPIPVPDKESVMALLKKMAGKP